MLRQALGDPEKAKAAGRMMAKGHRPRALEEFINYVWLMYGSRVATNSVCPGHTAPGEMWWRIFNNEIGNCILVGSRGSGKTWGLAMVEHMEMDFNADDILHAGAIEAQSEKGYAYFQAMASLPHFRDLLVGQILRTGTKFKNGGNIQIVPGTVNQLNGPHTRILVLDELELFKRASLKEAVSIPMRRGDRPPVTRMTSSRKYAHGPMEERIKTHVADGNHLGIWCVLEVMEQCPPDRHRQGKGCRGNPEANLPACPLMEDCLLPGMDEHGNKVYLDGPGRAAKSNGHMNIDDVIAFKRSMDKNTWDSQWLSKKASTEGMLYPMFDPELHVLPAGSYQWNPAKPVYLGADQGFTNPSAFVFAQLYDAETLVIFHELYGPGLTGEEWAVRIKALPFFANISTHVVGDPAAAEWRASLNVHGIGIQPADNDMEGGVGRVRMLLAPAGRAPLLYFTEECVNTIDEMSRVHVPIPVGDRDPKEKQASVDDHAPDAVRYLCVDIFGRVMVTGSK